MKIKILYLILIFLLNIGCEQEPVINRKIEKSSILRFKFPQGNSEQDKKIQSIADKYDTHIIYKDLKQKDVNRDWLFGPSDKEYISTPLTKENLEKYTKFINNEFLNRWDAHMLQKSLPIYIYVTDSLKTKTRRTYNPPGGGEQIIYYLTKYYDLYFSNYDYWVMSINKDKLSDSKYMSEYRCRLSFKLIEQLVANNEIIPDPNFKNGIDYETWTEDYNKDSPDYFKTRGFVENVKSDFSRTWGFNRWAIKDGDRDFLSFTKIVMFMSEENFYKEYPKDKYPKVHNRYQMVKNVFKQKGINLYEIGMDM